MADIGQWVLLVFIGLFVGVFGTLIGAAGGFILIPILLFLYPGESPALITSISLTVVFFNALSGSISYLRLRRIDIRSGLLFSAVSSPAAMLGAYITQFLDRQVFQITFGVILLLVSAYLLLRPRKRLSSLQDVSSSMQRCITDCDNRVYTYRYNLLHGMVIAFFIGLLGGLLGLGGGIMHVPAMTQILCFPAHIATATSHFVVALTVFAAIVTRIATGEFFQGITRALVISLGAVVGAPLGARLSRKVSDVVIIRLLAAGLAIVALRLLIAPF